MKTLKTYLLILIFSIVVSLYFFESYLTFFELNNTSANHNNINFKKKIYKKKTNLEYDTRTKLQVYDDYKKEGVNLTIPFFPHILRSKDNLNFFPFSGPSYSKSIHCNENGYWTIIDHDRYGFNNPDSEWDAKEIEYILIGDSFTFGACVNRPHDVSSILRNLSKKSVLNLGYRGNGPLMEYATLKEYFPKNKKVKNIIWLYFEGNDNYELTLEIKNNLLNKYLVNSNYKQDLIYKQKNIDELSKLTISELQEVEKEFLNEKNLKNNKIKFEIVKFLKIKKTRKYLKKNPKARPEFYKILDLSKKFLKNKNSILYFVYLPQYERYTSQNYSQKNYKQIKKKLKKLNIRFIDVHADVFEKEKNPLSLFPFESNGHYNKKGYNKIAELIYKSTSNSSF